jgi:hypothetical protein
LGGLTDDGAFGRRVRRLDRFLSPTLMGAERSYRADGQAYQRQQQNQELRQPDE